MKNLRVLCLNDDFVPLNTIDWQKAMKRTLASDDDCPECYGQGRLNGDICDYCKGLKVIPRPNVVEFYDVWIRGANGRQYPIPAVIVNTHHVTRPYRKVPFSRKNVFRRDNYCCAYCGKGFTPDELTLDHVVPRALWKGKDTPTSWTNVVTACKKCNSKKGNKTIEQLGWKLTKTVNGEVMYYDRPRQPSYTELVIGIVDNRIPKEWEPYLATVKERLHIVKT